MFDIKNNNVILYLETILNKNISNINMDDIVNLKTLVIDCKNEEQFDYATLKYFKNLNNITIMNATIKESDINYISQILTLNNLKFVKSTFENENILEKLDFIVSLELSNCIINDYNFLQKLIKLEVLKIQNPRDETVLDLNNIKNCIDLKELVLNYCIVNNEEQLGLLPNCKMLSLLGTDMKNFLFLDDMINLKRLFISKKYEKNINTLSLTSEVKFDLIDYYFEKEVEDNYSDLTKKLN